MSDLIKVKNQHYLKDWDAYVNNELDEVNTARAKKGLEEAIEMPARKPALLPIYVGIKRGALQRERISSKDVETFYDNHKNEIPDYMRTQPNYFPDIDAVFEEYIDVFSIKDGSQSTGALTPLDIVTNRPTYMLFTLNKYGKNKPVWRFSEGVQISCENDGVGPFRNILPICTLDDGNSLLVLNRHRSDHPHLKFNLHVTISQIIEQDGENVEAKTPIIIDPGLGNGGHNVP